MSSFSTNTAERQRLAGVARPSADLAVAAYPWHGGATRLAHLKPCSEMITDVFAIHLRWPGDPSS